MDTSTPSDELQTLLNGPSTKPPGDVVPNFDNPPNRNREALAVFIVCMILTTLAVLARAYSRAFIMKRLHIEDYLGFCAFLPFIAIIWCVFDYGRNIGFFVHQWDLYAYTMIEMGYLSFTFDISYDLMMGLLKSAILIEWIRIFVPKRTRNTFFWTSTFLMALNACVYVGAFFTELGFCQPLEKMWNFWVDGKCIDWRARDTVCAVINLIMDVFIFLLPQRTIWSLQISPQRKIGISLVFSVGLLTVALATGRLYTTIVLDYADDPTKKFDTAFRFSQSIMWVFPEITCVFLVFCVPALPRLFKESGLVSYFTASWRSWKRLTPPSTDGFNEATWPQNIDFAPITLHSGIRSHRLADVDHQSQGCLNELAVMHDKCVKQTGIGGHWPGNPRIVKTVELDQCDGAAPKISTDPFVEQHPWMER